MTLLRFSLILLALSFTTACNWAPLNKTGKKVRVLELSEVKTCRRKGKTTVSTTAKIAGIPRSKETIAEELTNLARNMAPELKGDTVVIGSPIKEGKQTFIVYKCIDPNN